MKRKLFTLLLSLAMVVTMMPMTAVGAFAASTSPFTKAQLEEPFYIQATAEGGATTSYNNETGLDVSLLYKVNNGEWKDYKIGEKVVLNQHDKVFFKAGSEANPKETNTKLGSQYKISFCFEGDTNIGGNIMSLLDGQTFSTMTKFPKGSDAPFRSLFFEGGDLISAKDLILPAMQLVPNCYEQMFHSCKKMIEAPLLPATELADWCYDSMFIFCSNLEVAPELNAKVMEYGCYDNMFGACHNLKKAPELPSTQLADWCYDMMFANCPSLEEAPSLPALEMKPYCYAEMFSGCESLTKAPELPSTQLAESCYQNMFEGCKTITKAPKLPATELAPHCYSYMFSFCQSLVAAPELPATKMKKGCYSGMFASCYSLETAPELPARQLADDCYNSMFQFCSSLTKGPVLPATQLNNNCYFCMFQNCELLEEVEVGFTEFDQSALYSWLEGVSDDLTFVCKPELLESMNTESVKYEYDLLPPSNCTIKTDYYNQDEQIDQLYENTTLKAIISNIASKVKLAAKKVTKGLPPIFASLFETKEEIPFYFEAAENDTKVELKKTDDLEVQLLYKVNNGEWQSYNYEDEITLANAKDRVYFKAATQNDTFAQIYDSSDRVGSINYNYFTVNTGLAKVGGNIMSLLDGENFSTKTSLSPKNEGTFYALFADNENITSAKDLLLPATELAKGCYAYMFAGCASLKNAPKLPAKVMKRFCYMDMFRDCAALTETPELPATELASCCYSEMFLGCKSLNKAPYLPAEELAYGCYYGMFSECTSLQEAELPSKELSDSCYVAMFAECTSLKEVKLGLVEWDEEMDEYMEKYIGVWMIEGSENGTLICTPEVVKKIQPGQHVPEGWKVTTGYQNQNDLLNDIWTIISFPTRMFNIIEVAKVAITGSGILSFFGLI